ncbi:fungal-specific transcription factor domain-containing protein [Dactylonectria macrodidyma]|uniref:Fungal-specific transcription factor domain-containing protein n=1 Tax=Dactylonectria macrodidyma TaxID=307937 RepID=A0A9P9E5C4_9HYPO|nr:fungal-specific transcription factor domain-containing protein [Dactylonectria macrodidyma]
MFSSNMSWEIGFDLDSASFAADASNILPREPPPKRRKIQLACNSCRMRKTRCDGRRPVCSPCEKRGSGDECLYEEGTLHTRKHIQALESRLEQLERGSHPRHMWLDDNPVASQHNSHVDWPRDPRPRPSPPREDDKLNGPGGPNVPVLVQSTTHSRSTIRMASATTLRDNKTQSSDALATVSACIHDPDVLYGASSTISFVERVLLTTGEPDNVGERPRPGTDEKKPEAYSVEDGVEESDRQTRQLSGLELLPIRRIADSYQKSFWDIVHPIFPVLHRPTFTRFYNQLWGPTKLAESPEIVDDPVMLATLNLVLAIGCRFTVSVHQGSRAFLSDQFYQRARGLVPIDALDVASLAAVQMLLLTAVHLQSTTYSSRCWNIVGLAMRVAQSLGLHLNGSESGTSNQREREMRRRVWYTCVTLDRLISTTFGRPAMLSNSSSVPLPLIVDDEYLLEDGEGTQPVTSQCRIGSFVYTVQLLELLNEVLHSFYAEDGKTQVPTTGKHEERPMPDLHEMLRLNSKLDRFLEDLPTNLRLQNVSGNSEAPTGNPLLQARVLYCRFLYTRLLLLRPVILSLAHSASITFGAATIVLASRLCSPQDGTETFVDDSLSLAMAIFRYYTPEVESATQAIQVLEDLRNRLPRGRNKGAVMSHREVQLTKRPNESSNRDSEVVYGSCVGNIEYYRESHTPDPLSEDWFSRQALDFNFQEYLRENYGQ